MPPQSGPCAGKPWLPTLETRTPQNLSGAYLKGLNFLLNDQSDKAIDAFVEVVRIAARPDPDDSRRSLYAVHDIARLSGEAVVAAADRPVHVQVDDERYGPNASVAPGTSVPISAATSGASPPSAARSAWSICAPPPKASGGRGSG